MISFSYELNLQSNYVNISMIFLIAGSRGFKIFTLQIRTVTVFNLVFDMYIFETLLFPACCHLALQVGINENDSLYRNRH